MSQYLPPAEGRYGPQAWEISHLVSAINAMFEAAKKEKDLAIFLRKESIKYLNPAMEMINTDRRNRREKHLAMYPFTYEDLAYFHELAQEDGPQKPFLAAAFEALKRDGDISIGSFTKILVNLV